ncbi:MAG: SET domain-containing protein-lysine N-methyltransferase [Chlamydiia bacterium]|nr:SET domain-containing protein-lysine N-methyltransferase [Chlamydiia bacterium]
MKFRLQRQEISKDLFIFCLEQIKKNKIHIPRASKKIVTGLPSILKEIQEKGLPNYLLMKKLKGKLGYGIFLHPEAKPILKGTPIAPYSGKVLLCPQNMENDSDYTFALISDLRLTKEEQSKWDSTRRYHPRRLYALDLDALKRGNFTRFINHSETPNIEACFIHIPANLSGLEPAPFELIYVAKKTIHPGEQLLVCYEGEDKSYWGHKTKPFPMTPKTFRLNQSSIPVPPQRHPRKSH